MKAAVHLGPNYTDKLEVFRKTNFEELQNLFDITQRLILDHQAEILNVSPIDWIDPSWTRSSLTHEVITWTKAKVHVFSDSVFCLRKMSENSEANQRLKNHVEEFRQSNFYRDFIGIDGQPTEFECNNFPGLTSLELLQKIQKELKDQNIEPEKFEERIIFMSMFNDINWTKRGNSDVFQSPNKSRSTEEIVARTLKIPRPWREKEVVRNSQLHLTENGIPSPHRWWNGSKKPVTQYSRASVL